MANNCDVSRCRLQVVRVIYAYCMLLAARCSLLAVRCLLLTMYYVAACTFRVGQYTAKDFRQHHVSHRYRPVIELTTKFCLWKHWGIFWGNFSLKIRAVVNDVYSPSTFVLLRYFIPLLFWIYHVSISTFPSNDEFFDNANPLSLAGSLILVEVKTCSFPRWIDLIYRKRCAGAESRLFLLVHDIMIWYEAGMLWRTTVMTILFVTRSSKIITNRRERTMWNIYNSLRSFDLMHLLALSRN